MESPLTPTHLAPPDRVAGSGAGEHTCPYCYRRLSRDGTPPAPFRPATTMRDCTIGLLLGLVVMGFVDIGIFVRRDETAIGFGSNLVVAAILTTLLALWYRGMRAEVI